MIVIEGTVEDIIYTNEANGYTVCELSCGKDIVTAVGCMPFINPGEAIRASGKWVSHPDYGEQFKVEIYEKIMPQTADAIEKYLSSGIVKGVGPATAARIVDKFGAETLEIINKDPKRLSEIKGISLDKAMTIGQALNEQRGLRDIVMFLQEYGISPSMCLKIYKAYADFAVPKIKENPYRLCEDIFGIGFKTADVIAMKLGINPLSEFRIKSGIKFVLSHAASNGHTFLPEQVLKESAGKLLGADVPDINNILISLIFDKSIVSEKLDNECHVYLSSFYTAEQCVCKKLLELSQTRFAGDMEGFDDELSQLEKCEGIELAQLQKEAIREAMTCGVLVITGGSSWS